MIFAPCYTLLNFVLSMPHVFILNSEKCGKGLVSVILWCKLVYCSGKDYVFEN